MSQPLLDSRRASHVRSHGEDGPALLRREHSVEVRLGRMLRRVSERADRHVTAGD